MDMYIHIPVPELCTICIIMLQGTEHPPQISRESGVNIIAGTSYYIDAFVPPDAKMMNVQEV